VKQLFEHNAAEIRRLHQAVNDTFKGRSDSKYAMEAWQRACAEFSARYDQLAFPGGLGSAFERLAACDPPTAETAVLFLELHPYFHRSQYIATKLVQFLKKLELRSDLQERFDAITTATRERRLRRREEPGGKS